MWRDSQEMSRGTCDQNPVSPFFCESRNEEEEEEEEEEESPLYHPAIPSALNVFQRQSNGFV